MGKTLGTATGGPRARELELAQKARAEGAEWLNITGPVGIGKSRFARKLAGDSAHWIDVGAQTTADLSALFRAQGSGTYVLDGCDSLDRATLTTLADQVSAIESLTVIATCRRPLGVPGERVIRLGPLGVLTLCDIFLRAADRISPTAIADRALLHRAMGLLDGNPLATVLFAHRAEQLSLRSFCESKHPLSELVAGPAWAGSPHHRTMTDALSSAWSGLAKADRLSAARLSVIRSPFLSEEAASLVALWPIEALALTSKLTAQSWLSLGEDGRYRLGALGREFAWGQVPERDRERLVALRAEDLVRRVEPSARRLLGPADTEAASLLAESRAEIHWLSSVLGDSHRVLHARLFLLESEGDRPEKDRVRALEVRWLSGELSHLPSLDAACSARLGTIALNGKEPERARHLFDRAESIAADLEDPDLQVEVLLERARSELAFGDQAHFKDTVGRGAKADSASLAHRARWQLTCSTGEAGTHPVEQAVALLRLAGDVIGEARALNNLGVRSARAGESDAADKNYRKAAKVARAAGHARSEAIALSNLANARGRDARWRRSLRLYEQALSLVEGTGAERLESMIHLNLGITLHVRSSDVSEAAVHLSAARDLGHRSGAGAFEALACAHLAALNFARGETVVSVELIREATALLPSDHAFLPVVHLLAAYVGVAAPSIGAPNEGSDVQFLLADAHLVTERTPHVPEAQERSALRIDSAFNAFELAGHSVSLVGHPVTRRLLRALVEQHEMDPGVPVSTDTLFASVWPEEGRAHLGPARNRVWVQLSKLRKLGLRDVLRRGRGGYLLVPSLTVVVGQTRG